MKDGGYIRKPRKADGPKQNVSNSLFDDYEMVSDPQRPGKYINVNFYSEMFLCFSYHYGCSFVANTLIHSDYLDCHRDDLYPQHSGNPRS